MPMNLFLHLTGFSRTAFEKLNGILFKGLEDNTIGRPELLGHAYLDCGNYGPIL